MSLRGPRKCARPSCRSPIEQSGKAGRTRETCGPACKRWLSRDRQRRGVGSVHFSSATPEWYTPPEVFEELSATHGPFDLDPAADPRSPLWALVPRHWTVEDDGLAQPWTGRVWLNPPYGRVIGAWLAKAAAEVAAGRAERVVCLVPARTDTAWWAAARAAGATATFRTGRIRFLRPDGTRGAGAAFPSAVVVFGDTGVSPNAGAA